jgi:peptidoglycan/LPS O-acetylase OafA/YrhL
LWSLGVEEQFYLIWPALMVLGSRKKDGSLLIAKTLFLFSFAANVVLTTTNSPAAFYLPFSRFWELMMGAFLAIVPFDIARLRASQSKAIREAASCAGALLLVLAMVLISMTKPFPGSRALLPTLGTALLIFAGKDARLNRAVLSLPPLVYVGLLSYPLYLWHWPILTFTRIFRAGEPTALMKAVCILLALVLADLTYRLIEKPIRFEVAGRTLKTVLTSSVMVATAIVGFILGESKGMPSRFPAEVRNSFQDYSKQAYEAYRAKDCLINVGERFGNCEQDTVARVGHAASHPPGFHDSSWPRSPRIPPAWAHQIARAIRADRARTRRFAAC